MTTFRGLPALGVARSSFAISLSNGGSDADDSDINDVDSEVDDSHVVTPEPGSLVLLLSGFVAMGGFLHRRLRKPGEQTERTGSS